MQSKSEPESEQIYRPESIALFEALYGKNLISLGGLEAVDNMFSDLKINGLKALDIGFGLGGVAFYLAKAYGMQVSGVEIHPWMAKYATDNTPKEYANHLKFDVYNDQGQIPFAKESFDMVYSKGVLNHVQNKAPLFLQVIDALKPNGLFVIADWLFPESKNDAGPLVFETKQSYQESLEHAGFKDIDYRDDSQQFLGYVNVFLDNLASKSEFIKEHYGQDILSAIIQQHHELIEDITNKNRFATRIVATY